MHIKLRKLEPADLATYKFWKQPIHKYHKFNGPYFRKASVEEIELQIQQIATAFEQGDDLPLTDRKLISNDANELLGEVNWYWKSVETNWLEVGIIIFDENNWYKGIGKIALSLWINEVFASKPALVRIGLTTWSGNTGMMKLAEKLGLKKEAEYRKARIVDGQYYASVSYGLLKEEWEAQGWQNLHY